MLVKDNEKLTNNNDIIEKNFIKRIRSEINYMNTFHTYYTLVIKINFMIIYLFCQIKANIEFDAFHFQDSKIILKINRKGYYNIIGNNYLIKYIKNITINGNKTDNTVEIFLSDNITSCVKLFYLCNYIEEIDLFNFDTSQVQYMGEMFSSCYNLKSLNVSNLNTSQVISMMDMFYDCHSLISLDLSSFDTSKVNRMHWMFIRCYNLISLNLSSFNTSKVMNMDSMFNDCRSLISLDLSSFDTSRV